MRRLGHKWLKSLADISVLPRNAVKTSVNNWPPELTQTRRHHTQARIAPENYLVMMSRCIGAKTASNLFCARNGTLFLSIVNCNCSTSALKFSRLICRNGGHAGYACMAVKLLHWWSFPTRFAAMVECIRVFYVRIETADSALFGKIKPIG